MYFYGDVYGCLGRLEGGRKFHSHESNITACFAQISILTSHRLLGPLSKVIFEESFDLQVRFVVADPAIWMLKFVDKSHDKSFINMLQEE